MTLSRNSPRLLVFLTALLFGAGLSQVVCAQESPAEKAFNNARQLYHDGKLTEAFAAFQQYESQHPFSTTLPQAIYFQGCCQLGLHQYQEAIDTFDRLLKLYPTVSIIPEMLLKEADCYRELKNYPKAIALYRQFETQYSTHALMPQAMLGEAWILFQQDNLETAEGIVEKVRAQFANDAIASLDSQFLFGQILTAKKNYTAADEVYQQIVADNSNPRISEGFFLAGEAMFDARRYTNAIACYERVQSNSTFHPTAIFRIANCRQLLGRTHEAAAAYRHFLSLYPDDKLAEQAQFALIQVLTERHEATEANDQAQAFDKQYPNSSFATDVSFLQAEAFFASGQFSNALDHFQTFAGANKNPQLLETADFRIAACWYSLHNFGKARDSFIAFLQKHPQGKLAPDALFRLSRSYFEISQQATDPAIVQTNLASAVSNFEQLRLRFPTNELVPEATFQLGYLYSYPGAQDADKEIASFQEFINRWPNNRLVPEALYLIGRSEKPAAAITAYEQLIDKYPRNELVPYAIRELAVNYIAVGNARLRQEQFANARSAFQKSLALNPNDAHIKRLAQIGFANTSLALNQLDDAENTFRQVLAVDPRNAGAELGLAKVYLMQDPAAHVKAVDLLDEVMAGSQGEHAGEAAFLLGNYFFNLQDNQKENKKAALAYYLRAALLMGGPHSEEAAFRSGQCHEALGNNEAARSAFQAYLRRFPNGKFAGGAKQELASLPGSSPQR